MKNITLSKYPFVKSISCVKSTFLHYHQPELKSAITVEQQLIFDKGKEIGLLAQELYSEGEDISQEGKYFGNALIQATKEAILSGKRILYEAAFESDTNLIINNEKLIFNGKIMFVADIVVISDNKIRIIEIKSSTKIKSEHVFEIGFQRMVMENCSTIKICGHENKKIEFWIGYINNEYVKDGPLDINQLFHLDNVTTRAKAIEPLIIKHLKEINKSLFDSEIPKVNIGEKCSKPHKCEFYDHCWSAIPPNSVYSIGRLRKTKAEALHSEGYLEHHEIPKDEKLTNEQWIEVSAVESGKLKLKKKEIQEFLETLNLSGPMFFLDFESMMGIPRFDGTRPYQQICFQYACLYRENENSELIRKEFLANPGKDPRREFTENLLRDTEGSGVIVVYNQKFEISRLRELGVAFPEFQEKIDERISRIRDLLIPFEKRYFYHPKQLGSASIKKIQPLLVPELDYSKLDVSNGSMAMNMYEAYDRLNIKEQIMLKRALLQYCYYDVLVMVRIIEELQKLIKP